MLKVDLIRYTINYYITFKNVINKHFSCYIFIKVTRLFMVIDICHAHIYIFKSSTLQRFTSHCEVILAGFNLIITAYHEQLSEINIVFILIFHRSGNYPPIIHWWVVMERRMTRHSRVKFESGSFLYTNISTRFSHEELCFDLRRKKPHLIIVKSSASLVREYKHYLSTTWKLVRPDLKS